MLISEDDMEYDYLNIVSDLQDRLCKEDSRIAGEYVNGFELRCSGSVEHLYFNGWLIYDSENSREEYNDLEERYFTQDEFKSYLVLKATKMSEAYVRALKQISKQMKGN